VELEHVRQAGKQIAIVQAPNMSIGMNLLFQMVKQMAGALGSDYDIEIVEQHHRFKKDAPSGSALGLLNSVAEGLGKNPKDIAIYGREGRETTRKPGEVGVHAVRLGDTVGEHVVYFGALGETVSISHSAHSRDTFAQGAIRAAKWLMGKKAGVYSMQDVLFGNKE
jgi:4-hydroxy-tetrahydrodipicolinate reductase